jgi:KaiC/GvpD/RAD55 family RecA-like ATPase/tetratricopeptide (TPR) repeat protein
VVVRLKTGVLAEPVLVGRECELEELQRCLDSAVEGMGTTVFVSGEAGSGKTRLTTEFLSMVKKRGVAVLAGWCLGNAAVPYFPFVEAFDAYFSSGSEENLSPQHPEIGADLRQPELAGAEGLGITAWLTGPQQIGKTGKPSNLSPQVWKDQAFAAVAKTLHSISAQEPIILFLEDIHWADSASLALLHYIARAITSERILVLATYRSEELTADAEGHPHPLVEEMRLMRREDLFKEINLPNLDQNSVSKIAENMIGGSVHPELAEKLSRESRGNPLFIVESLRMLSERKSLVQENDKWRFTGDYLGIPEKLKDIILRRLSALKFSQRRVLDAASVIGEKFDVDLLGAVLSQDSLEVLETLNMIAQSTSLVCVEENFYRFDHEKSREAICEEIPSPLRRGYHAKIAERLENTSHQGKPPFSDIAYHYAQAGNKEEAAKYALAAGQDALARWSNQEAIKHFIYVVQNISETSENAESRRIAQEGLGDAYYANCMYEEAARIFESIANSETGKLRLRAYRKTMDAVFRKGGEHARLMGLVKRAEPYAALDRLESARILWSKARAELHSDPKASLKDHEEALRVFEEEYSLPDVAQLLCGTGFQLSNLGFHEKALNPILRSIPMFQELNDAEGEIVATHIAALSFGFCGLFEESSETCLNVLKIGEKIGHYSYMTFASQTLGAGLELRGIFGEAISQSLKALEYSQKTDNKAYQYVSYANLSRQYARLGDLEHAEEYFNRLPPDVLSHRWQSFGATLSKAVLLAAKNQWKESDQHFEKAFEHLELLGHPMEWELQSRTHYAWALSRQGRVVEEKVQLEEIQKIQEEVEKRFQHVDIDASVMAPRMVFAGEEFEMRLVLVNISRKPGFLAKAEDLIPTEFEVTATSAQSIVEKGSIEMKNKVINPFQVETIKLKVKASKPGAFTLNPKVSYIDELGETKTCKPTPITITVQPAKPKYEILPGRITTGYAELDALLLGGIPENYAVVLAAPSCDERQLLIRRFLEAGAKAGETTLYVTCEAGSTKDLVQQFPSNFSLLVCSLQADLVVQSLPNVYKLKGIDNLTEIDIALTKLFRTLDPSQTAPKRACIDLISDVLLQHHAVIARKWLSSLLANLKSRGFTTLAVIDPRMHPPEEAQAILGLFEGEVTIREAETDQGLVRLLKVKRMSGQKYLKEEARLTEE